MATPRSADDAGAVPESDGRGPRRLAYGLACLVGLAAALGGLLLALDQPIIYANDWFLWGLFTLTEVAYVVAALAIVRHQPTNAVGWLMFLVAGSLAMSTLFSAYGVYAVKVAPGSLPFPAGVLALAEMTPGSAVMGILLIVQLFPNGHPVRPRWGLVVWATVLCYVLVVGIVPLLTPHLIHDIWSDELSHAGVVVRDPFGLSAMRGVERVAAVIVLPLSVITAILSVVSLFVRRARADATTRIQLRWLALVVGAAAGWILVMIPVAALVGNGWTDGQDTWATALFWLVITPLVALGPPIAVGIAIVKHRLLDIDVVIKKTVVFAVVAAVLVALYLAVIALATVGTVSRLLVGVVLLAVTFNPVRRAARALADRIVYGKRATSYEVLADFSERMGETYATDDVLPRMAQILAGATGATTATVWLLVGGALRPAATDGTDAPRAPVPVVGDVVPQLPGDFAVEVRHQGELLGALSVTMPANDPMDPGREKLVRDLASQAGLVLRNVRLIEELKASRQRLVAAQDEERRKLERNIHDGAQQQLVALSVKQRLLGSMIGRDDEKARAMAAQLGEDTTDALENLRDLARGIYPPLLADQGLGAALVAQARKAAVATTVDTDDIGRYPQEIESAVYFSVLEGLNNVAKYAGASRVAVRLSNGDDELRFVVTDDGRGFDSTRTSYGTGLQGIADRLAALGGSLDVVSSPGTGTTIDGRLPAEARP